MRFLLGLLALLFGTPAYAAYDAGDIICETSTTTGTGTLNLAGAVDNYVTFTSQITSGSSVNYHIRASDGTLETGVGVLTDAGTDTLTRVAYWSTDGSGAELTLPAGTHTVCLGPTTQMFAGMKGIQLYTDDAGAVGGILPFWHDSSSAADGDIAANIQVWGGADDEQIGSIQMEVDDGATTSEDTQWKFVTRVAGADIPSLSVGVPALSGDVVPGSEFNCGSTDSCGWGLVNTSADAGGPLLSFYANSATPANSDQIFQFIMNGEDSAGNLQRYGRMRNLIMDPTSTAEYGMMDFAITVAGTLTVAAKLGETGFYRFYEATANGANYKAFITAAANTATTTCTFEDDANFVPDSCVGDGSDASDARLKTDVKPAGDVGGLLDQIKIYDYAWTADAPEASEAIRKGKRGFGPVAQELFNVNADFVGIGGADPIKDPWTWKPEKVVPYLIVEVQNLRKRLANQACYGIKLGNACIGVSM
jgi:hypothetical protein